MLGCDVQWGLLCCLWLWTWSIFVAVVVGLQSPDEQARIINGEVAPKEKWPFMAAILQKGSDGVRLMCGGSVVNEDTILTAAHCLDEKNATDLVVYVGTDNIHNVDSRFQFEPKELIIHERFTYYPFNDDIAMIKLKRWIDFDRMPTAKPACFTSDHSDVNRTSCFVIGWGYMENNVTSSDDLRQLQLPILNDTTCAPYTSVVITYNASTMLCAGYFRQEKSHCKGDSGGPLVCPFITEPDKFSQQGIVSNSRSCIYNPNYPAYYTKVVAYLDWIELKAFL